MIDIAKATLSELQAEFVRLGNSLSVISGERLAILNEMNARKSRAAAKAKLLSLDKHEKDALREELKGT